MLFFKWAFAAPSLGVLKKEHHGDTVVVVAGPGNDVLSWHLQNNFRSLVGSESVPKLLETLKMICRFKMQQIAEKIKKSIFQGTTRTNRDFKQEVQGIAETDLFFSVKFHCLHVSCFYSFHSAYHEFVLLSFGFTLPPWGIRIKP